MPTPAEVARSYDQGAAGYDARHRADPRTVRRAELLDRIQLDAAVGARRVLELGCGTGRLLGQVTAPVRIGVDVSAGMLAEARARQLEVARADAHALPFADASFDAILAGKGVFRYLDLDRALAECVRVLRPGGVLALHQYAARTASLFGSPVPPPGVWHLASVAELVEPARRAGLAPRAVRVFRSIRIRPYLLEIPRWLDARSPLQLWSHCVAVFSKSA